VEVVGRGLEAGEVVHFQGCLEDILQRQRIAAAEVQHRVVADLGRVTKHVAQRGVERRQVDSVIRPGAGDEISDGIGSTTRGENEQVVAAAADYTVTSRGAGDRLRGAIPS